MLGRGLPPPCRHQISHCGAPGQGDARRRPRHPQATCGERALFAGPWRTSAVLGLDARRGSRPRTIARRSTRTCSAARGGPSPRASKPTVARRSRTSRLLHQPRRPPRDLVDDRLRRAGRREQALPVHDLEVGEPRLFGGRHVAGSFGSRAALVTASALSWPDAIVGQRAARHQPGGIDMLAEHGGDGGSGAAERDVRGLQTRCAAPAAPR